MSTVERRKIVVIEFTNGEKAFKKERRNKTLASLLYTSTSFFGYDRRQVVGSHYISAILLCEEDDEENNEGYEDTKHFQYETTIIRYAAEIL